MIEKHIKCDGCEDKTTPTSSSNSRYPTRPTHSWDQNWVSVTGVVWVNDVNVIHTSEPMHFHSDSCFLNFIREKYEAAIKVEQQKAFPVGGSELPELKDDDVTDLLEKTSAIKEGL